MRREVLAVQESEMLRHLFIAAHRKGHACAGVDATFSVVPMSARKTVIASIIMNAFSRDDHRAAHYPGSSSHVTDWRRRSL